MTKDFQTVPGQWDRQRIEAHIRRWSRGYKFTADEMDSQVDNFIRLKERVYDENGAPVKDSQ